jgi:hypothetical protein
MELDGEGSASLLAPLPVVVVAGLAQGLAVAEADRVYDALAADLFLVKLRSVCEMFANVDVISQGGANATEFTKRVSFYLRQCFRE